MSTLVITKVQPLGSLTLIIHIIKKKIEKKKQTNSRISWWDWKPVNQIHSQGPEGVWISYPYLPTPPLARSKYLSLFSYYYYYYSYEFSRQRWEQVSASDSKSPQVSRTLLSILAVPSNAVVWMVSTHSSISNSSSLWWLPRANQLPYLPTPPLGQDMTQGQFFKRNLTGLSSEFSFS